MPKHFVYSENELLKIAALVNPKGIQANKTKAINFARRLDILADDYVTYTKPHDKRENKNYGDSRSLISDISSTCQKLTTLLEQISHPESLMENHKDWRTAQLISSGMSNAKLKDGIAFFYPKIWEIKEEVNLLGLGAKQAMLDIDIKSKKGTMHHPADLFVFKAIHAYENFFCRRPTLGETCGFLSSAEYAMDVINLERPNMTIKTLIKNNLSKKNLSLN
jgi:hypothetical protein